MWATAEPDGQGDCCKQHNQRFNWVAVTVVRHLSHVVREWVDQQEKPHGRERPPAVDAEPQTVQGKDSERAKLGEM
jgi:hypothetical protein